MLDNMSEAIRAAFRLQAQFTREAGSPFTARVLDTLSEVLNVTTRTGARILDWPGDPIVDALKLRIAGGLNALARSGDDAELFTLYETGDGDFKRILKRIIKDHDDWLYPWLDSPPQTNEVGRAGVLWPGIMDVARRFGPRVELIELGPSGGLNLNMDRFGYDLGGALAGDPASRVQLRPDWSGPAPAISPVDVVTRIGVDQNPLDVCQPEVAERLMAYVWPDQPARVARIEAAIAIANGFPPPIEAGDAAEWIEARLAMPQAEGVTRIVYHSIVLVYLSAEGRQRVRAALAEAGSRADANRPLAWLSMEHHAQGAPAELRLTCWPEGKRELLATVHPHGAHVNWIGATG